MKVVHLDEMEARQLLLALRAANAVCDAVGATSDNGYSFPGPGEPAAPRIRHGIRLLEDELDPPQPTVEPGT
jgi:hypothetical protein